jgi:hypothetical protein
MRRTWVAVLAFGLLSSVTGGARAAEPIVLQPHRAVYDLTLARADDGSQIDTLEGRMVYEFTGSPCQGYTTRFRFVTRIESGDNQRMTDLQTSNFETADGKSFSFTNKTLVNSQATQEVSGAATENGQATLVQLTRPPARALKLEPSQFPTTHMVEIIRNAEAGQSFYQTTIFDGSDNADKVMATTVVIGKSDASKTPDRATNADAETGAITSLAGEPHWPVSIAYFDPSDKGAGLPTFRTTFVLYANGITRNLTMDYGDFAISGKLVDLKLLDKPKCPG